MTVKTKAKNLNLVGGASSVDFVNTVGGRESSAHTARSRDYQATIRSERLDDYAGLLAWSKKGGLLTEDEAKTLERKAKEEPRAAAAVLKRAIKLREAVYRLFKAAVEGWPPEKEDMDKLNQELSLARAHENLVFAKNGFSFEWKDTLLDRVLWTLAQSAADVLTSEKLSRLKQCGGEGCGWIFLDTSRSGNRIWCDMRDCGNLAKVHRFRRKDSVGRSHS